MRPIGKKAKNEKPGMWASVRTSCMTRLGGVPMRVSIPPILLAKASGIRRVLAFVFVPAAILTMIGNMSATVPVLLINPPIADVVAITSKKRSRLFPRAIFIILLLIIFANPVCKIAPLTTNSPAIINTIGFEKPANASEGLRMFVKTSDKRAQRATMSDLILPKAKKTAETAKMIIVVNINNESC